MADDAPASHPLEHKWTLWFDNQKSGGSGSGKMSAAAWGQTLRSVYSFDTVEDFWRRVFFDALYPYLVGGFCSLRHRD